MVGFGQGVLQGVHATTTISTKIWRTQGQPEKRKNPMKNRKRLLVLIGVLLLCLGAATDQLAVSIFKTPKPHLFDVSTSRVGDGYVIKMGKSEVRAWLKDSKIVFTSRGLSEQVQKSLAKFADNHLTHTTPQRALDIFVEKDVPFQLLATAPIERDLALSDPE